MCNLPLQDEDPGLLCPKAGSGEYLVFQLQVGEMLGLASLIKLLFCLSTDEIGIVALIGPCFPEFGDDFCILPGVD